MTSMWCLFVNFEHISHLFLVFPIIAFKQIKVFWEVYKASQLTFICSRSTIETLEKGVKYVLS